MKALITGASSGIGKDMAIILSEMGYDLILVARRSELMEELKKKLKTDVRVIPLDISSVESCYELYKSVNPNEIDILINNAGFGIYGEFAQTDINKELEMIDINIRTLHLLTKLFLNRFIERNSGYILNVSSAAGFLPGPLMAAYYATKAYVLRLTQGISEEIKKADSTVYIGALCPGPVKTEFDMVAQIGPGNRGLESMDVAKYAIKMMLKRKTVIVPGIAMKLTRFFVRLVPDSFLLKMSYMVQKKK